VTAPEEAPTAAALGSALLFCESCGRETVHRILSVHGGSGRSPGASVRGTARCRECRWTHAFASAPPARASVDLVVSSGAESRRTTVELPPATTLRVGELLPEASPPARLRKLDLRDGRTADEARARDVRTAWAIADGPRLLRVAVLEGAWSTTERLAAADGLRLGIGDVLRLPAGAVTIVALRARGHTWRRAGDVFDAGEVAVVYGRRIVRPPAGRSGWSRERGTPSSRASSTSRSARSRSSPGASRKRTVPRARTASGGATSRYSSLS